MKKSILYLTILCLGFGLSSCDHSRDSSSTSNVSSADTDDLTVTRNADKNAYFGDLHVHTSWSFDAFIYNVRTDPDDAYAFAKGEAIDHFVLDKIKIERPLDFMAVTDHSEYMGVMKQMIDPEHAFYDIPLATQVRSQDRATSLRAFGVIGTSLAQQKPIDILIEDNTRKDTWQKIIEAADLSLIHI